MLGQQKEPLINAIVDITALAEVTVEVTDTNTANGSSVDLGISKSREEIILVDFLAGDNVDAGFLKIQESIDQAVWVDVCTLVLTDGMQQVRIQRKARYLRTSVKIEFVQPDAENPVDSTYHLSVKVVQ